MRKLLVQSMEQYRQILGLIEEIATLELDRPEEVGQMTDRLLRLQEEAAATDRLIQESLAGSEPPFTLYPLMQERMEVMSEIVRRNGLLSPRIEAKMASTLAELNEIRTGMTAMAGYRPAPCEKGKRLQDAY